MGVLKHLALVSEKSSPDSRSLSFHQDEQFRPAPLQESDADKSISVSSGDSLHKSFLHLRPPLLDRSLAGILPTLELGAPTVNP